MQSKRIPIGIIDNPIVKSLYEQGADFGSAIPLEDTLIITEDDDFVITEDDIQIITEN
jgi:hypothetical protein